MPTQAAGTSSDARERWSAGVKEAGDRSIRIFFAGLCAVDIGIGTGLLGAELEVGCDEDEGMALSGDETVTGGGDGGRGGRGVRWGSQCPCAYATMNVPQS